MAAFSPQEVVTVGLCVRVCAWFIEVVCIEKNQGTENHKNTLQAKRYCFLSSQHFKLGLFRTHAHTRAHNRSHSQAEGWRDSSELR